MTQLRTILPIAIAAGLAASSASAHAQTLDAFAASFGPVSVSVEAMAVQPDGRIVIGGAFMTAGTNCDLNSCPFTRNRLARLLPDGAIDSFNPGANGTVHAIALQADHKILVAGVFSTIGGGATGSTARRCLARLNPNGTVDPDFDPIPASHPGSCSLEAILVQPDGKIIIAGLVTQVKDAVGNIVTRQGIARLNPDGSVDAGYYPGIGSVTGIRALALDAQGRLLVGGSFSTAGHGGTTATTRRSLARFLSDGTLDPAFDPGVTHAVTGTGSVEAIAVQADGQILLGGAFTGVGGGTGATGRTALARIDDTGLVDALNPNIAIDAFNVGTLRSIVLQADGRILIAGNYLTINGVARTDIARLNSDGSLDGTFADVIGPALAGASHALALQSDGRILIGGHFSTSSGAIRNHIARYVNTSAGVESLAASGASITWTRGGTAPELETATFESTTDGVTWTSLGPAQRMPGGWHMTGLALPPNAIVRAWGVHRSSAQAASGSLLRSVFIPAGVNLVQNADFSLGTAGWAQFATPDLTYIVSDVTGGVFRFYRRAPPPGTSNQALVFRETGIPVPSGAAVQAAFDLGNADNVRKRVSILLHDSNFTDLFVCTFWLPANAPLQTYGIATHTSQSWTNATISIYAASANAAANTTGYYLVDNVSLTYNPAGPTDETACADPTAPLPPGGPDGPELLQNGDFGSGALLPGWGTFGQITFNVTGGVFQFHRPAGTPAGVVLQPTLQALGAAEILTASFQLGNSSFVRVRVTVLVHDNDFSDLAACTFWLPAAQPLSTYTMRVFTTKAWSNATLSVYPSTVGTVFWTRLDNVSLRQTPGASSGGVGCFEPGAVPDEPPAINRAAQALARAGVPPAARDVARPLDPATGDPVIGSGQVMPGVSDRICVTFWLPEAPGPRVRVEASEDGTTWQHVWTAQPTQRLVTMELDLSAFEGRVGSPGTELEFAL